MKRLSFKVAFGGIVTALCILIMFSASILPFMTYVFPMISGLLIYAVSYECGVKIGLSSYAGVSILLLILSPEKESALMFAFFFGYYPIISVYINRLKSKVLQWIIKLFIFNFSMVAAYFILLHVFVAVDSEEFTKYSLIILLAMGNLLLFIYDIMLKKLTQKYIKVYRKKLLRRK